LVLEILHSQKLSKISQVETLTEFRKCKLEDENNFNICADQFQAIYYEPGRDIRPLPIRTQKFKLVLSKIKD